MKGGNGEVKFHTDGFRQSYRVSIEAEGVTMDEALTEARKVLDQLAAAHGGGMADGEAPEGARPDLSRLPLSIDGNPWLDPDFASPGRAYEACIADGACYSLRHVRLLPCDHSGMARLWRDQETGALYGDKVVFGVRSPRLPT